jgi:Arc/MetJ-type ribon-helix-helix transcriptional regulator
MEVSKELPMAYQFPPNIERLVKEQMASGAYESEDDLLADALRALATRSADLAAVNDAIRDMEAGDTGRSLTEVAEEIRTRHGWSTNG